MNVLNCLLVRVLRDPHSAVSLSEVEWDLLVRQAKRTELISRLCVVLDEQGILQDVPEHIKKHLVSARIFSESHQRVALWEAVCIPEVIAEVGVHTIFLKGAAYVVAKLGAGNGRVFSDIDILVPKQAIDRAEQVLKEDGWMNTKMDAYDQKYYRKWMHEIPPLRHMDRKTVLDVHHAIVPETAPMNLDVTKLFDAAVPVAGHDDVFVLAPNDMVIHSATHLFSDGEFNHSLRDLVDLDILLRDFGEAPSFYPGLVKRASELDLGRPLFYALRYTSRVLNTPVPAESLEVAATASPGFLGMWFMDKLFMSALAPDHKSCNTWFTGTARWLLYMRAHRLRMPFYLLIPHLLRKSFKREKVERDTAKAN